MKFKKFLLEGVRENIIIELNEMSDSEIHEFGEWIYTEFYEMDEEEVEDGASENITKEEIIELLGDMTQEDLEYIYYMITDSDEDEDFEDAVDAHTHDNENIEEGVARRMAAKNRNKKKRKFMANSQATMRRTKVARKKEARASRAKRKRDYRKNKVKKKAYAASRSKAIDSGKHIVKLRKKA